MAKKKLTLEDLASDLHKGFAAIADDIADIKRDMATKAQIATLHTQVNAIETQLRDMRHTQLQARVADLEENVFGKARR